MKFAVIAAGEGSRLAREGVGVPKPLVEVGGETLLDRLVRVFLANGATEIDVVCNDLCPSVASHLAQLQRSGAPLHYVVQTTPSSMHSLYALSPLLEGSPFVLTTVDTIFREDEFARYVGQFRQMAATGEADGLMGVTDYIDDECPLYVKTAEGAMITAFADTDPAPVYISGGIYGLTPPSLATLRRCIERGDSRMRNFQRALLADGLRLRAYPFTKVLDIDHATDIGKAERFLQQR